MHKRTCTTSTSTSPRSCRVIQLPFKMDKLWLRCSSSMASRCNHLKIKMPQYSPSACLKLAKSCATWRIYNKPWCVCVCTLCNVAVLHNADRVCTTLIDGEAIVMRRDVQNRLLVQRFETPVNEILKGELQTAVVCMSDSEHIRVLYRD
jgi:hypothetical protein